MIELLNITKRFSALLALDHVSLRIAPGTVHGVLGENGAGKSTIMNVLFGLLRPDAGTITIDGKETRIHSPREAQRHGIGMVHQHFKLVPTLTVVENLAVALGQSVRTMRTQAAARFNTLKWQVPLQGVRVESLAVGQQQRVEIVKALMGMERGGRTHGTLILDEPTAVLTPQETAELFTALDTLKATGTSIVFISHKLAEVRRICEEVTILRRGRVVHSGPAKEITTAQMTEKMVGANVELPRLVREAAATQGEKIVLELRGITAGIVQSANLQVRAGEIVGIAGVDGNGQGDLVQAIIGGLPLQKGSLALNGENATHTSIHWRMERLAYIAEDRQRQAVVLPLSIQNNLMLKAYRQEKFSTMGWLRFSAWRTHSRELVKRYDVRCGSVAETVGSLSGGNQQKVVLARELSEEKKSLVIAVNPTRGLDVGATAFVMQQLLAAREREAGVLLVHSDLDELLAISDRVVVIFEGRLRESAWPAQGQTKEEIGKMMLGAQA
jgi:simple sugar transport system ATP-binding protein